MWNREDKERTALHEAGHAVVAWFLGAAVLRIRLDLEMRGGDTETNPYSINKRPRVHRIAAALAGSEAEWLFKPPADKDRLAYDIDQVIQILEEDGTVCQPAGIERRESGRAFARHCLREHEVKVRRIARHLVNHNCMERLTFEAIMAEE